MFRQIADIFAICTQKEYTK